MNSDTFDAFDSQNLAEITSTWPIREKELLSMYVNEAMHFSPVILRDVEKLPKSSLIKEVGSGIGMLSILVADRDFRVISFEPESAGFSIMKKIRSAVTSSWLGTGNSRVEWIDDHYSAPTTSADLADFIFAVNVVEHVPLWRELISNIIESEKPDSRLRLIFPNYIYPYEPHFQIPTLFNKRVTRRVMRTRIVKSNIANPDAFWDDLSWPTGGQVKNLSREMGYECAFSQRAFLSYLERFQNDESFRERKGKLFTFIIKLVFPLINHLANRMPGRYLPVIDVTIYRRKFNSGGEF